MLGAGAYVPPCSSRRSVRSYGCADEPFHRDENTVKRLCESCSLLTIRRVRDSGVYTGKELYLMGRILFLDIEKVL